MVIGLLGVGGVATMDEDDEDVECDRATQSIYAQINTKVVSIWKTQTWGVCFAGRESVKSDFFDAYWILRFKVYPLFMK